MKPETATMYKRLAMISVLVLAITVVAAAEDAPAADPTPEKGFSVRVADKLKESLESGNYLVILPLALVGGMLLALTPCVLPMVHKVGKDAEAFRDSDRVLPSGPRRRALADDYSG